MRPHYTKENNDHLSFFQRTKTNLQFSQINLPPDFKLMNLLLRIMQYFKFISFKEHSKYIRSSQTRKPNYEEAFL